MKSTAARRPKRISEDERLDRVFGALSDRTRRSLLSRLARAPSTVTELAAPFEMSLPAVSKHIRVLERAGLIKRDVDGRVHRCSFDAKPLEKIDDWLTRYRGFWSDNLDALAEFVERESE